MQQNIIITPAAFRSQNQRLLNLVPTMPASHASSFSQPGSMVRSRLMLSTVSMQELVVWKSSRRFAVLTPASVYRCS